uniref:Tetratricopeptide SHNi-TPR domain-containing protein n=1 Tax=Periophthalmus magnuspinnatus TaxID=409849 RepID=A0A3B4A1N2_9GOBI
RLEAECALSTEMRIYTSLAGNMEEANKLIGLGKKHLVMGKVVEAVNTLQEACSMLAKKYGDTADECGEAFYWCGKALLDLARMENSVLGNALQGVPEEDEEEEEEEEEEEKPKDSNMEMESTENLDEETENEEAEEGEGSDDEEVGNLQLAWEMLEVAKVIYKRKEAKEDQLMAAQTHLKLGEVSAESGNYTQAVEDFQECLKLQLKHLESDSRLLAETHYQLGLTYSLNCQYKQAIGELNSSISVIKSRIDKAEGPDALPEERKEMDELKALLPEIQEKIEDATEGLKTASTDAEAVKDVLVSSCVFKGRICEQTTASDISHLVRKKVRQKMRTQTNSTEEPQTNEVHTNGRNNGHSDSMEVER